jgi:hypothetical protein
MKCLVHEGEVDTREDLIRGIVGAATRINDQGFIRFVVKRAEGALFERLFSSESPGYLKSCTIVRCHFLLQ